MSLTLTSKASTSPSRLQISAGGTSVLLICVALGLASAVRFRNPALAMAGLAVGLYFLFAIRVAEQWEKAAVLRLGRYIGLRGPGIFMIVPIIDRISLYVDQRVRVVEV